MCIHGELEVLVKSPVILRKKNHFHNLNAYFSYFLSYTVFLGYSFKTHNTLFLLDFEWEIKIWNQFDIDIRCITLRALNLRQDIFMKTRFKTRVSRMGLDSFVNINIFVMKYHFFSVCLYSPFFSNL